MTIQGFPHPPIHEVVCGVGFTPLPLNLIDFSVYAAERFADYPNRELHPLLIRAKTPPASFDIGLNSLRLWLLTEEKDFILQIQRDRFFMNWRRVEDRYPSFNDKKDYNVRGLKSRFTEELDRFQRFCLSYHNLHLDLQDVEVTKTDRIIDPNTIRALKPLQWELERSAGNLGAFNLQFRSAGPYNTTALTLQGDSTQVFMETHAIGAPRPTLSEGLDEANARVNATFLDVWPQKTQEMQDA